MNAKDAMVVEETRRMMELEETRGTVMKYRAIIDAQDRLIHELRELIAILKQSLSARNEPS